MPTYVYRCRDCGRQFEHFEKMTSKRKSRKCPACGGRAERQISGGAGFLFKGEGFYITDYRSAEYRSKQKSDTETASEGKSDGKPAAPESVPDETAVRPGAGKRPGGGSKKKKKKR